MSEEIKQKDKLKDGFEDLVINDTGKNFDDDMFIIQDWWLKQFDSLLAQAVQAEHDRWVNQTANEHDNKIREITLQKRDEAIKEEVEKLIVVAHSHKLHCKNYSECRQFTDFETTHNRAVTQVLELLKKNISTLTTK